MMLCLVFLTISSVHLFPAIQYRDAKKAYTAGNYDKAVTLLAERLRRTPKHKKSIELLLTVLPIAYERHNSAAEDAELRQDWDEAIKEYIAISKLSREIRSLPPVMKPKTKPPKRVQWPTLDIAVKHRDAIQNAADVHYDRGMSLMESGKGKEAATEFMTAHRYIPNYKDARTFAAEAHYRKGTEMRGQSNFKEAAVEFRSVAQYVRAYKDASSLYTECREAAIKRVAVMPFENKSGKGHFGAIGELLSDQIISKSLEKNPEFIEFVTRDRLNQLLAEKGQQGYGTIDAGSATQAAKIANVHAFVFGSIQAVTERFPPEQKKGPETNSAQFLNYSTAKYYTVSAKFWLYNLEGLVEVMATLSIIDGEKGTILKKEQMKASATDLARWVTFTGDERAVPEWAIEGQTPGGQRPIKNAETLVLEAIEKLSSRLSAQLVQFFK